MGAGHGWWKQENTKEVPVWRNWSLERFPKAVEYLDYFQEQTAASRQTVAGWSEAISERGLWVLFDGIGGLFGLALFGSAWGDVKTGFRKLVQLALLVILCVVIHYVWAICWPVLSLVGAVVSGDDINLDPSLGIANCWKRDHPNSIHFIV